MCTFQRSNRTHNFDLELGKATWDCIHVVSCLKHELYGSLCLRTVMQGLCRRSLYLFRDSARSYDYVKDAGTM